MLQENKALFDRMGISRWHDAGYRGARGLSITHERPAITPNMNGRVELLWPELAPSSSDSHAYWTTMVHLQVAPERKIKSVLFWYQQHADGTVAGLLVDKLIPYMLENKVDTGFASIKYHSRGLDVAYAPLKGFCTLCNASGNDGDADYSSLIEDEAWLGIGAVAYNNERFVPEEYSSQSQHVDFCGIAPLYVPATGGQAVTFNGTSCAAPFLSGQMALVNDFFIDKIGRPLSAREMYAFVQFHCLDIAVPGKDVKTGHGVFIMPDPATINPKDWITEGGILVPVTYGDHSTWATDAVKYCVDNGIFKGDGNGDFRWKDPITREEMAQLIYNLQNK